MSVENAQATGLDANAVLSNEDLAPTPPEKRTWGAWSYIAIWMGISHNINQWILAATALALGLSFWQAFSVIILAFGLVYVGVIANSVCGAKYGISFPVIMNIIFGQHAAKVAIFIRAIIGVFYFGVFVYVCNEAINVAIGSLIPAWNDLSKIQFLGMGLNTAIGYVISLALHFYILTHGIERIRRFEQWAGPLIMVVALGLLVWAIVVSGGPGPIVATQGTVSGLKFWAVFFLTVTGQIGSMATLMVNVPDLTRFAKSQKAQLLGQTIGLPIMFVLFSIISLFATVGTIFAFGHIIIDPLQIMTKFDVPIVVFLGAIFILGSTLSLNAATNAVSVGFDFTGLFPKRLTFKRSVQFGLIISVLALPWLWYGKSAAMNTIFGVFGSAMGPLLAIMLIDFYLVRRRTINIESLYDSKGEYSYFKGFNFQALGALLIGFVAAIIGLIIPSIGFLYNFNWFIGVVVGGIAYLLLNLGRSRKYELNRVAA